MDQLTLLLVDRDIDSRMRLRHAVSTVQSFGETVQVSNLEEARRKLSGESDHFDIVFLSYEFPREQLSQLVSDGKTFRAGGDAAYVMLFPGNENRNARISEGLLAGADGFLFEPYSIDELVKMTELASKIKLQRMAQRQMLTIGFMIKDLVRLIDVYSRLTMMCCDTSKVRARLKSIHQVLQAFEDESIKKYLDAAVDAFMLQPTPDPIFQRFKSEGIRSIRLRQKLAENLTEGKEMHRKQQEEIQRRLPPRKQTG